MMHLFRTAPGSAWRLVALLLLGLNFIGQAQDSATRRPRVSPACLRQWIASGRLHNPFTIRLVDDAGNPTERPAPNWYFLDAEGNPKGVRPEFRTVVELLMSRTPQQQHAINQALNALHAATGNSFFDKSKGVYFVPDVNGMLIPMPKEQFDALVQSTGAINRALDQILKGFHSSPNPTAKEMGIEHWPKADQVELLRLMRESAYTEPLYVHPAMKDYPHLFATGYDSAIDSPTKPGGRYYEYNFGTPSGISNDIQLVEAIRIADPELFKIIAPHLEKDRTFSILREKLQGNALHWTGNKNGISVIVGPGPENAAHPDISYISHFTGLPLVRRQDLYEDAGGNIRLNTGRGQHDPVVTGIYNRNEEAYFFNSPEHGIGVRNPKQYSEINERLSKQHELKLDPAVAYSYRWPDTWYLDKSGVGRINKGLGEENPKATDADIIDVWRDGNGKPLVQPFFSDQAGRDPSRPDAAPANFLGAVHNKKLYVSNLGGRTVDDKRIFTLVARNTKATDGNLLAQPPNTLRHDQYETFYNADDWSRYVVKEPDLSSAEGVSIMANLSRDEQKKIVEKVRANPKRYVVQEYLSAAVVLTPRHNADGSTPTSFGTRANDIRIFVFMGSDGRVDAGSYSVLPRVAAQDRGESNTGKGGGYGVFTPLAKPGPGVGVNPNESVLPKPPRNNVLPEGRKPHVRKFLTSLNELIEKTERVGFTMTVPAAEAEAQKMRAVMDLFGRDVVPYMVDVREFAARKINRAEFNDRLKKHRDRILNEKSFTDVGVESIAKEVFGKPTSALEVTWPARAA